MTTLTNVTEKKGGMHFSMKVAIGRFFGVDPEKNWIFKSDPHENPLGVLKEYIEGTWKSSKLSDAAFKQLSIAVAEICTSLFKAPNTDSENVIKRAYDISNSEVKRKMRSIAVTYSVSYCLNLG